MTVNKAEFWRKVLSVLQAGGPCALLHVVESSGSSPGRTGFKMAVAPDGAMYGSIGGGRMEHKLVELARSLFGSPEAFPFLKRQIHQAGIGQDRSGMICSGEQTVAFFLLDRAHMEAIGSIIQGLEQGMPVSLHLSDGGFALAQVPASVEERALVRTDENWSYYERPGTGDRIVIIGAGHVGLALSRTMNQLGFNVHLMDDRPGLNTMEANEWAHERSVVDYGTIDSVIMEDQELHVVLVSFGYRSDELLLRQLVRKRFKYLGMLGSAEKIKTVFADMRADGFTEDELARVYAPIGLPINSRTPEEIAVSIAAEIIRVKNVL
ncbi:MAG TPA: XdhC family protein [Flavobacteriales bacterium]|nr:XdhC family protein [Flavobacteriales bacterium]